MKKTYAMLFILLTLFTFVSAQDSNVTVIGSGDGNTKTIAVNQALRNCIEKSMGAFLSSSTTISNDSLVKDEIVSIASGNIVSYDVLSEINKNEDWNVTVSAIISPQKLISTLKAKGFTFELNGGVFAQNVLKERYYIEQEPKILRDFYDQWSKLSLFCFDILLGVPILNPFNNPWIFMNLDSVENANRLYMITHYIAPINQKFLNSKYKETLEQELGKMFQFEKSQSLKFDIKNHKVVENSNSFGGEAFIPVIFNPKFTDIYEKLNISLIKLLAKIALSSPTEFEQSTDQKATIITIEIPEFLILKYSQEFKSLQKFESLVYHRDSRNSTNGTGYYFFYVRNKQTLDVIKKLFNYIRYSSYPYQISSDQAEEISNLVELHVKSNVNYESLDDPNSGFFYTYAHRVDEKRSVITPVGSSENFATVTDTKVKSFLNPTVMLIPCTLDDLMKIKKIEFKSQYESAEGENKKSETANDKNVRKEELNLYLKNISDSINSTIKDKNDWVYLFDDVQTKPIIGDTAKFVKYASTQRYPSEARKNNTTGKVLVSYITEKDGSVSNAKIYKGIGSGCDEEAIRFISSMPKRIPAMQEGKSVRVITMGAFNCEPPKQ